MQRVGERRREGGREGEIIHKQTPSGNDDDVIELQSDITY